MSNTGKDIGVNQEDDDNAADDKTPVGRKFSRRMGDIHGQERSSSAWIVSFTDVMALMLTFFVLLFSMTEPSKDGWSEITMALKNELNRFYGSVAFRGTDEAVSLEKINFNTALDLPYLKALLEDTVNKNELLQDSRIFQRQGRLIVSMPQDLLFDSGLAEVKTDGSKALYVMGGMLSRIKNKIEITGHADPVPVGENNEAGFASNWSLSLARAASVAALLNSVGYRRDIIIRGHSSGRYEDMAEINDEDTRMALSRRVDIVIMDHDGAKKSVFYNPRSE